MHAFTLFKHQIECNQVQKLIGRLQKHTELFVTADISNKAKACRLKVMPLEDFMSLIWCFAMLGCMPQYSLPPVAFPQHKSQRMSMHV